MAPEWIYRISSGLGRALRSFDPGELAYLALTGKIELPLRDRLARQVHLSYPSPPYFTVREWNKTDLAVIEDGEPVVLLEAKALYSFDAVNPTTLAKYETYITKDIAKAQQLAVPETQKVRVQDIDHDGAPDVVYGFRTHDTGLPLGVSLACLSGSTIDDLPFVGCDTVDVR